MSPSDMWKIASEVQESGAWNGIRNGIRCGLRVLQPSGRFYFYREGLNRTEGDAETLFAALLELSDLTRDV